MQQQRDELTLEFVPSQSPELVMPVDRGAVAVSSAHGLNGSKDVPYKRSKSLRSIEFGVVEGKMPFRPDVLDACGHSPNDSVLVLTVQHGVAAPFIAWIWEVI